VRNLGQTRSSFQGDHYLQTPDTFIRAPLPGMKNGTAIVHAGAASGGGFCQYTAELAMGGTLGPTSEQRFVYVLEGSIYVEGGSSRFDLSAGGYSYMPEGSSHVVKAYTTCRIAVIDKRYQPLREIGRPEFLVGVESDVVAQPLMEDAALQVRMLLPDAVAHDFAVNTMTFEPGATLSLVEMHVMEHGLLMLEGGGIYRLGSSWYPVSAGDFIYMAPFCPQWFGALGKKPTKYLIYKDWNRHPAGGT
jgi:(S)-ureidoglycine aminohydrolase